MNRSDVERLADVALHMKQSEVDGHLGAYDGSWAPYYRFLYLCVKEFHPRMALETGTASGLAAAHMAVGCRNTLVVTIDKVYSRDAFDLSRRYKFVMNTGDSCEYKKFMEDMCFINGEIGLLFLDTVHDGIKEQEEVDTYKHLLAPEALIVVDDLLGPEHQQKAMMQFFNNLPGEHIELHDLHPRRIAPGVAYHDAPGFGVVVWTSVS